MTSRTIYLGGRRVRVQPSAHIGAGGEAEVFDLGDGRALKLFKGPEHPDFDGDQAQQCAARQRLHIHQRKLTDFPGSSLPDRVIGPQMLATNRKRRGQPEGQIIGYAMELIAGAEHLYRYAEPRFRRQSGAAHTVANQAIEILLDLQTTVAEVHAAGVVIGDFNDLNVLTRERRAYLIDADSFQYSGYSCRVFTTRFVDPLLCQAGAHSPILARPYTPDSDWYAFAVMVMRSLLCVGPYGGVHRPRTPSQKIAHARRPLVRKTVFAADVVYPRPAVHYSRLPDEVLDYLHATFVEDERGAPPAHLLRAIRWTRCCRCGGEHARPRCPVCIATRKQQEPARAQRLVVHGQVHARELVHTDGVILDAAVHGQELRWLLWDGRVVRNRHGRALKTANGSCRPAAYRRYRCHGDVGLVSERGRLAPLFDANDRDPTGCDALILDVAASDNSGHSAFASDGQRCYWLQSGQLHADSVEATLSGSMLSVPTRLGQVLPRQTRIWLGSGWGFGMYRAGGLTVGFRFGRSLRALDDQMTMPRVRAATGDWHAELGSDRLWLTWIEQGPHARVVHCACLRDNGRLLATASASEDDSSRRSRSARELAQWLPFARNGCALGPYLFVPTDAGIVRVEQQSGRLCVTREFPDTAPFVDSSARLLAGPTGLFVVGERAITRLTIS